MSFNTLVFPLIQSLYDVVQAHKHAEDLRELSIDAPLFGRMAEFLSGPAGSASCLGITVARGLVGRSPDGVVFVLRWLKGDPVFSEDDHTQILGIMTAVTWFSPNAPLFWQRLGDAGDSEWWKQDALRKAMALDRLNGFVMIPVPSPRLFVSAVDKSMYGFVNGAQDWEEWQWSKSLASRVPDYCKGKEAAEAVCAELWGTSPEITDEFPVDDESTTAFNPFDPVNPYGLGESERTALDHVWMCLWDRLRDERGLVEFAQRGMLAKWFPDGEEGWEWEYILSPHYITATPDRSVPDMFSKDWPLTIGNVRVWPKELLQGDVTPREKLNDETASAIAPKWGLVDGLALRQASFIDEAVWPGWNFHEFTSQELYKSLQKHSLLGERMMFAMINRICKMYGYWYDTLQLAKTLGTE